MYFFKPYEFAFLLPTCDLPLYQRPDFHTKYLQVQWETTDAVIISELHPKYLPFSEARGEENDAFGIADVCASHILKENVIPVLLAKSKQSLLMICILK